jgi:hypothetical protein
VRARKAAPAAPVPPLPPCGAGKPRGVRLRSSANVRAELARLYRAFRAGTVDANTARTSGFLLQTIASIIRDELEAEKLEAIEKQIAALTGALK